MSRIPILTTLASALLVAACGLPRSPDSIEARCAQGFASFEAENCQGNLTGRNPAYTRFVLDEYTRQCKDASSVARIQKIKTTCLSAQETALDEHKADRRKIRARYVAEVSSLLLDPSYGPLVDRYKDLESRGRESREGMVLRAKLAELATKHGIDPTYAKELQLW